EEPHGAEGCRGEENKKHVSVSDIRPEGRGDQDRRKHDEAAHCGRSCLAQMRFGCFQFCGFPDLMLLQHPDDLRPEPEGDDQRRDGGRACADRDVSKQAEAGRTVLMADIFEKVIEHQPATRWKRRCSLYVESFPSNACVTWTRSVFLFVNSQISVSLYRRSFPCR